MKIYRVYGTCFDWECRCERTMKAFLDKTKAENYSSTQSTLMIAEECGFCVDGSLDHIKAKIEELEVEE